MISLSLKSEQADEKVVRRDVAAGLPRHIPIVFNAGWRRKAASTSFFISLLERVCGAERICGLV
jgi:hypothetical protein